MLPSTSGPIWGLFAWIVVSIVLNGSLTLILGIPFFYATLGVSDWLLKSPSIQ